MARLGTRPPFPVCSSSAGGPRAPGRAGAPGLEVSGAVPWWSYPSVGGGVCVAAGGPEQRGAQASGKSRGPRPARRRGELGEISWGLGVPGVEETGRRRACSDFSPVSAFIPGVTLVISTASPASRAAWAARCGRYVSPVDSGGLRGSVGGVPAWSWHHGGSHLWSASLDVSGDVVTGSATGHGLEVPALLEEES